VISKRFVIPLVVVLLIVAALAVPWLSTGVRAGTSTPELATVARRSFPVVASATGVVVPASQAQLNFGTTGKLASVDVRVGDQVKAGQQIAKLDDTSERAALATAEGRMAVAQGAVQQAQYYYWIPSQLQQAQGQVAEAQGQIDLANANLAKTTLTAPIDGTVLSVRGRVGELIDKTGTVSQTVPGSSAPLPTADGNSGALTISNDSFVVLGGNSNDYIVAAPFAEADALRLAPAQAGTIVLGALQTPGIPCHVRAVATSSTLVSGVVKYYASIVPDKADSQIRQGMTADVQVTVANATDVLAVPNQAIYSLDNQLYVDVWYKSRSIPASIKVGLAGDKLTEITAGLSEGQQVVLSAKHSPSRQTSTQ
jgi:macrolide-specific efflux system membrane fusion protein